MWNTLEKKFGRFAIPNLSVYLIAVQVVSFVLAKQNPAVLDRIQLIPSKVVDGDYYRLFSFLASPPGDNLFWAFLAWYLFYLMGTALEQFWGTFKYNAYLLVGYLATVLAAFLTPEIPANNWFVKGTVFLAFAYLNPNFQLMIAFIFPVRIKWFALLTWLLICYTMIFGGWSLRMTAISSVLNFLLFFGKEIKDRMWYGQRFMKRQAHRFGQKSERFMHRCVVCGITDADDPKRDFRYSSSPEGDLCFCDEHLQKPSQ